MALVMVQWQPGKLVDMLACTSRITANLHNTPQSSYEQCQNSANQTCQSPSVLAHSSRTKQPALTRFQKAQGIAYVAACYMLTGKQTQQQPIGEQPRGTSILSHMRSHKPCPTAATFNASCTIAGYRFPLAQWSQNLTFLYVPHPSVAILTKPLHSLRLGPLPVQSKRPDRGQGHCQQMQQPSFNTSNNHLSNSRRPDNVTRTDYGSCNMRIFQLNAQHHTFLHRNTACARWPLVFWLQQSGKRRDVQPG